MSRRDFATAYNRVSGLDAARLAAPAGPTLRIPDRIILDVLIVLEIGIVVAAAAIAKIAYLALYLDSMQPLQPYVLAGLAGGIITHYVLRTWGLHTTAAVLRWRQHLGGIVGAVGLSFLALIAIAFLLKVSADYSRGWLLIWLGLVLVLLPVGRLLSARLLAWLASAGYTARRIAVVASGKSAEQIVDSFRHVPGVRIVGTFEDGEGLPQASARRSPGIPDLIGVGQRNQIDEVIVDLSHTPPARMTRLLDDLGVLPVDIWLCPPDISRPVLSTARLGSFNLLQVKPKPIRDWGALSKMAIDYGFGLVALLVFAPLMLIIAAAIKLDSPGKVFFRQRRHGYNHRVIDVFKFRTMHVEENGDRVDQARRNDPRVTRVGKFLRRTSLDELPQLFNVLKGEMSLVGPRPHAVAHNVLYSDRLERYANRHCVKPGITGWAQINGCRGSTEDPERMRQRMELDLHYIENWSPLLDLKILALTPFLGFISSNAY